MPGCAHKASIHAGLRAPAGRVRKKRCIDYIDFLPGTFLYRLIFENARMRKNARKASIYKGSTGNWGNRK